MGVLIVFQFHSGTIKRFADGVKTIVAKLFQFHSGTIKRLRHNGTSWIANSFQFHSGTIKSEQDIILEPLNFISFNSILVRLKAAAARAFAELVVRFNSILVRLKGELASRVGSGCSLVSIPFWYD